ncbi:hypothetical protein Rhe02_09510 [Rhizocola hellebori]|uniref:DUF3558 domain-containing protein n=1 Tax=Rhizocola hellebori TaxID=1392758 RepID=A0A8J3Q3Q0_9ACTN|nr:hypothetical protein [Rhizocola hellebori]GIH02884.1 hypothetical protein Rhe02_09510 [Rhizocola hellebori]
MKRRNASLTVATLAASLLMTGCTDDGNPAASTPESSSPSPSSPATPPTYKMPTNLCSSVSSDAFADLAPATPPKTSEMARSQSERRSSSTCVITLGALDKAVLVSVGVDLFPDAVGAQGNYEGFRDVVFKDNPGARDVTGVGAAAYFFADPTLGPHLVVQYGNAHLAVAAAAVNDSKTLPSDIERRLVTTAKATLNKLPTA